MIRPFQKLRNLIYVIFFLPVLYASAQNCCNADFSIQNVNNTYQFTPNDPGNANSWLWDLGDGNQRYDQSLVYTYTTAGNYPVTFTKQRISFDPITQDTIRTSCSVTRYIRVEGTQTCNANFAFQQSRRGVYFYPTDYSSSSSSYWVFGDGGHSYEEYPFHQYDSAGVYTVCHIRNGASSYNMPDTSNYCESCMEITVLDPTDNDSCNAQFTHTTSGNTTAFSFRNLTDGEFEYWFFGDGDGSSDANPVHVYNFPGTYAVYHHVYRYTYDSTNSYFDSDTCVDVQMVIIEGYVNPDSCDASFGYTVAGNTVYLNANFSNANTEHSWYFGDGSFSSEINPSHTYSQPGNYLIRHRVFNHNDSTFNYSDTCTLEFIITISDSIQQDSCDASFGYNVAGNTVYLNANFSNANTDHSWYFGDGSFSSEINPSHTYSQPGNYLIRHRVFNHNDSTFNYSDTCTLEFIITISDSIDVDSCNADFNYSIYGNNVALYSFVQDGNDYQFWDFGDGQVSTESNPYHYYTSAGTYVISHQVLTYYENNGGFAYSDTCTAQYVITIRDSVRQDSCNAYFSYNIAGNTVDLSASSTNANADHTWQFGDGSFSNEFNPSHTYTQPGNYLIRHRVVNHNDSTLNYSDTCSHEYVITISDSIQDDSCNADFNYTISGNTIFVQSFVTDGNDYQIWSFGDGAVTTETNPGHTYDHAGTYIITHQVLTYYENNGGFAYSDTCTAQYVITISDSATHDTCSAYFNYNLAGNTVFLNSVGTDANDYQIWQFGDGNVSFEANPTHTYSAAGVYTITHEVLLYDENASGYPYLDTCKVEYTITITDSIHHDTCSAAFLWSFKDDTLIVHSDLQHAAHSWNFGDDSHIVGNANNRHLFNSDGIYNVCHTVILNGDSCTSCAQITAPFTTSSAEPNVLLKPEVLPNPTSDVLIVRSNQVELKFYSLSDMFGNTVATADDINAYNATIDTSTISSGSYILTVSDASGNISRYNIIVQH